MMFFIEGHVLKLILHLRLFISGYREWVIEKCLSNNCRNNWPNLVFREDEKKLCVYLFVCQSDAFERAG